MFACRELNERRFRRARGALHRCYPGAHIVFLNGGPEFALQIAANIRGSLDDAREHGSTTIVVAVHEHCSHVYEACEAASNNPSRHALRERRRVAMCQVLSQLRSHSRDWPDGDPPKVTAVHVARTGTILSYDHSSGSGRPGRGRQDRRRQRTRGPVTARE